MHHDDMVRKIFSRDHQNSSLVALLHRLYVPICLRREVFIVPAILFVMSAITVQTLPCGATAIIERMSGVRSASSSWMIPGGSAFDPVDAQGRATMWGELLLRGAGDLASREQADAFDRMGVSRSTEVGAYTIRIASGLLGVNMPTALPLLMDMAQRPRIDDDAIEPCRDLALQAIESLKDDPQERASLLARARHYAPPLDRSGMGTPEGLAALTTQGLRDQWKQTALPGGSILGFAGDLNPDQLFDQLHHLTESWRGSITEPPMQAKPSRGYAHEEDPSNQVQIIVLADAPAEKHPDSMLERVAAHVLSGGMAGRLFTEVREKRGLCYSVSASYRGDRDFGTISAYVGTTPEKAQESLDVLFQQLRHIRTPEGQITPEEFQRAIVGMKSSVIFSGESTGARAATLVSDFRRLGRARSLDEIAAQIDAITLDAVNAYLARKAPSSITIQTLGPRALTPPADTL
jgi:predicted Zn-dependent peptidase